MDHLTLRTEQLEKERDAWRASYFARVEQHEEHITTARDRERRLVEALVHALIYYAPSVSAEAEVLSYLNGYNGDEDIVQSTGLMAELNRAREEQRGSTPEPEKHHPDCEAVMCGRVDCGREGPCFALPSAFS